MSRLAPRKGHRTVLHALAKLRRPGLRYVFTGVSDTLRSELDALAAELGVRDQIEPVGFVPEDELGGCERAPDDRDAHRRDPGGDRGRRDRSPRPAR